MTRRNAKPTPADSKTMTFDSFLIQNDTTIRNLLRSTELDTLALALAGAPEAVRSVFFRNMSERAAAIIRTQSDAIDAARTADIAAARASMLDTASRLQDTVKPSAGDLPCGDGDGQEQTGLPQPLASLIETLRTRPAGVRSSADMAAMMVECARIAEANGILALEAVADALDDAYLREGLHLVVDGVDPDCVRDVLDSRRAAILEASARRMAILRDGLLAIQRGETPRQVQLRCEAHLAEPDRK